MTEPQKNINTIYYEQYYAFPKRSEWMEKIWSEAFGESYPPGLQHYGYLTQHDLKVLAERLALPEGSSLLDIGCGIGGPGLHLAQELKLQLTGIDIVEDAVSQANQFQKKFNLSYPAHFMPGEFMNIPLEDESVDGVISIDSLWVTLDKIEALRAVKRVMKPGAKFVFTHWDLLSTDPVALLETSGLKFVYREDTPDWKEYQRRVYAGIKKYEANLVEEMGESANMLLYEAQASPPYLDLSVRRIYHFEKP